MTTWRSTNEEVAPPNLDKLRAWALRQIVYASDSTVGNAFRSSGVEVMNALHPDNPPPLPVTDQYIYDLIRIWAEENGVPDFQMAKALDHYSEASGVPAAAIVPPKTLVEFYTKLVDGRLDHHLFTERRTEPRGVSFPEPTFKELLEENNRLLRVIADRVNEPVQVRVEGSDRG